MTFPKLALAVLTMIALSACGGGGGGGGSSAGTPSGGGTQVVAGPDTTGVTAPAQTDATVTTATGELQNRVIQNQGLYRQYSLFKPANPAHEKRPLVIWFHGAGGTVWPGIGADYWTRLAGRENFYLLEPQAVSDQYQSYTYWNAGLGAPRDDALFVTQVLDSVIAANDIDTDRIYIGGMSSGGHMAFYMAQALRSRVAAVAPISGSIATYPDVMGAYTLGRPMPLCHIHGTADTIVNINGGDWYAPWSRIRDFWLRNNGITAAPTIVELPDADPGDGSTVTRLEYRGPTVASDIDDYRINGGIHSVPGIDTVGNEDFNAYDTAWTFFKKHKLSDAK